VAFDADTKVSRFERYAFSLSGLTSRNEMTTLQSLLPKIDSTSETRRSTPATVPTRGGEASAANSRQTEHGRATDDERQISRSREKKGGKYDSELERLTVDRGFIAGPRAAVTK
jgi:hypothetical protein